MIASQQRFAHCAIHRATRFCCGGDGGSSSTSNTSVVDHRIGASENAHVVNIEGGAFNSVAAGSKGATPHAAGGSAPAAGTPPADGSVQALTYTESGGVSVTGQGNSVTVSDQGAIQSALDFAGQVTKGQGDLVNNALKGLSDLSAQAAEQPAKTVSLVMVGAFVVAGLAVLNRK